MGDAEGGAVVAVIEDDEVARWALGRVLQAGGFSPALFGSAEAFVAARHDRAPLCVIIDVHLTGMSGIELQSRLRSEGSVPVIMTTGDRADSIRERAHQAGCAAFLWKPFTASTILGILGSIEREARH